jgi:hypothetical protein
MNGAIFSRDDVFGRALRSGIVRIVRRASRREIEGVENCHARKKRYKVDDECEESNRYGDFDIRGNRSQQKYLHDLGMLNNGGALRTKLFITDRERKIIADRLAEFERTRGSVEHIKSPLEMLRAGDGEQDASTDSVVLRRIDRRETDAMAEEIAGIIAGATPDAKFLESEIDDERIRMTCKRFGLAQPTFERIDRSRLKSERAKQAKRKPKRKSRKSKRAIETTSA